MVAGSLAELLSGNPGDIPKFVEDMMKPFSTEETSAEVRQTRPKSEGDQASRHSEPSCYAQPKSEMHRASDAAQLLCETHQKPDKLREKQRCQQADDGRSILGEQGTIPRVSRGPPESAEKPDTGSKDDQLPPITISMETRQLVDELKRQYSLPVFVSGGDEFVMDDERERQWMSSSCDSHQQKPEPCEQIYLVVTKVQGGPKSEPTWIANVLKSPCWFVWLLFLTSIMPVTRLPQIGTKNRYQKTSTGFWRVWHAVWYRISLVSVCGNE